MNTQEEAQKKWCPFAGTPRFTHQSEECIGSHCMAWRKIDQIGIGPNGEKRDRDMDGRTRWVDRGVCGLVGSSVPRPRSETP